MGSRKHAFATNCCLSLPMKTTDGALFVTRRAKKREVNSGWDGFKFPRLCCGDLSERGDVTGRGRLGRRAVSLSIRNFLGVCFVEVAAIFNCRRLSIRTETPAGGSPPGISGARDTARLKIDMFRDDIFMDSTERDKMQIGTLWCFGSIAHRTLRKRCVDA